MRYMEELKEFKEDYAKEEFKIAQTTFNKFGYVEIKYELQEEFLKKVYDYYKKRTKNLKGG